MLPFKIVYSDRPQFPRSRSALLPRPQRLKHHLIFSIEDNVHVTSLPHHRLPLHLSRLCLSIVLIYENISGLARHHHDNLEPDERANKSV